MLLPSDKFVVQNATTTRSHRLAGNGATAVFYPVDWLNGHTPRCPATRKIPPAQIDRIGGVINRAITEKTPRGTSFNSDAPLVSFISPRYDRTHAMCHSTRRPPTGRFTALAHFGETPISPGSGELVSRPCRSSRPAARRSSWNFRIFETTARILARNLAHVSRPGSITEYTKSPLKRNGRIYTQAE